MAEFGVNTRSWLVSVIRQRKTLIKLNCSHKSPDDVIRAIEKLELQLGCYTYENDLYMARFISQYGFFINTILPGKGSSCYERRYMEWNDIRKRAALIELMAEKTRKPAFNEKIF